MSNKKFRSTQPSAEPQAAPPPVQRRVDYQHAIAHLENSARRKALVEAAIESLYLCGEGKRVEAMMRMYDSGIALATHCREDELKRFEKTGVTLREKGDRPLVSVSEGRLYGTKQQQLLEQRAWHKAVARELIMSYLQTVDTSEEAALRVALDVVLGVVSEETRAAVEKQKKAEAAMMEAGEAMERETSRLIGEIANDHDRARFMEAFRLDDLAAMQEVMARQPQAWLARWAELVAKVPQELQAMV